ncbi:MAG: YitT family protein [Lachnospiraceae bacterium]|nr:YitT family protein [Lachnospiraceae bacterium]
MRFEFKKDMKRIVVICFASILMAANIKTFVRTGDLFPGGASGLTILIQRIALLYFDVELPYTLVNLLLNAIPVYIGFRFIGKKFTMYSCLTIVLTSTLTDLMPGIVITYDTLLISVFGGMINGLAISLCLRMGATTGGTDFISIFLSERRGVDSFNVILGINAAILTVAGLLFGWDRALYSIFFQFASTQTLHLLYKKYQQQTLFIVTNVPMEVCTAINAVSHHSATILDGLGSYDRQERNLVYSVVSSAESKHVIAAVKKTDPHAFINAVRTEQLSGQFYHEPEE